MLRFFIITIAIALQSCFFYNSPEAIVQKNSIDNATLIVLAYPEAICNTTNGAYSKFLPLFGIGSEQRIRAGHACLVVVKNGSDTFEYFDNGRYTSPSGYCRVRGANTDPELAIDIKPKWKNDKLVNVEELLNWLYQHPEKTHGSGRLYASVCTNVDYENIKTYINSLQEKGLIEYGPFVKDGTNCARFVTDAIFQGSLCDDIRSEIEDLYILTPSGLDNVEVANSFKHYYIASSVGVEKANHDLSDIQLDLIFDGGEGHTPYNPIGSLKAPSRKPTQTSKWLSGEGAGSWFDIKETRNRHIFEISSYDMNGNLVFTALYRSEEQIDLDRHYKISYPSTYQGVVILVNDREIELQKIEDKKSLCKS